ncbi:phosphate ABC transporter permease subunit PstC [Marinococcus halophilus]|uniref:Phosphate transport system permease protein n=1 Tax=Marinococcus halophilus TaxID=1371 RepID=A0A510Y6F0_MARHA|nr:phosphate ABC transporter permease subunit PstC [Marinococcus halophilus]OZT80030.1 phosphate ABC transporter permease subunit PstC [Marinococcus halophilus]GEK58047.1 phosphate transport system permease protein [Marinococcus halophilus]
MEDRSKLSISERIEQRTKGSGSSSFMEKLMPIVFFICALISVLTTVGIVFTLLFETITFFSNVPFADFFASVEWYPFFSDPQYGIWPLVNGTLMIAGIAMLVAVPFGLGAAIYLSEYASEKVRKTVKPVLEVLAGIPTIVYGFFALTFVTPILRSIIPGMDIYNALSPGIIVGVMIIPMIASLSEDAMSSVPNSIRQGAFALGATRMEVTVKVVMPAALSGIIASFVLGISRAIGETMIVTVAGGASPTMTLDPTGAVQTMTAYIVQATQGDAGFGTPIYYSIYAVGMTLFVFTLAMNLLAHYISRRFREDY